MERPNPRFRVWWLPLLTVTPVTGMESKLPLREQAWPAPSSTESAAACSRRPTPHSPLAGPQRQTPSAYARNPCRDHRPPAPGAGPQRGFSPQHKRYERRRRRRCRTWFFKAYRKLDEATSTTGSARRQSFSACSRRYAGQGQPAPRRQSRAVGEPAVEPGGPRRHTAREDRSKDGPAGHLNNGATRLALRDSVSKVMRLCYIEKLCLGEGTVFRCN